MNKLRPFFIVGGLGVIGFALYRYYLKQINFLKEITYQVTGLNIRSITANQVSIDITTKIYNASNVEATVKEIFLDIFINNVKVGNVNEVKDILILPRQTTEITFNFSFNPRLIGKNLLDIISLSVAAKDVIFDAKGYIRVKSSFITTSIPFEYQNNIKSLIKK
jgi:LEA14-like dessication related protein